MTARPSPPDALPQYLIDGVPKQGDDALRALRTWIDELLEHRRSVDATDIEVDDGEEVQDVRDADGGTVVIKKVSCGKENCRCQRGELHGPYEYVVRRVGDDLRWEYRGPVTE